MPASNLRFVNAIYFTFALAAMMMAPAIATAEDRAQWKFNEFDDPGKKGQTIARLVLRAPGNKAARFSGTCTSGGSERLTFSAVTLAADVGNLKDGDSVKVRFSGGGLRHTVNGEVYGNQEDLGVVGVLLRPRHGDKLWTALIQKRELEYVVPGYRTSSLQLDEGWSKIEDYISACGISAKRTTRVAANDSSERSARSSSRDTDSNRSSSGISEKEAFENAKELDTADGWEAFLNSYNTGFRADLARAYVKRLANGGRGGSGGGSTSKSSDGGSSSGLSTINPGPGSTRWATGKKRLRTIKNRAVYAASVRAKGVELITYCGFGDELDQGILAVLREHPRGAYPDYDERIRDALSQASTYRGENKDITVRFASGREEPSMTMRKSADNGELMIGSSGQSISQGQTLAAMMSEQTMTISAPPFETTIQLTGSRNAICRMAERCGEPLAGCSGNSAPIVSDDDSGNQPTSKPKYKPKPKVVKKKKKKKTAKKNLAPTSYDAKRGCKRNQRYAGGKCRNAASASEFCGPGYAPRNGKCTQGAGYNF